MNVVITDWSTITLGDISSDIFNAFESIKIYDITPPELTAERINNAQTVLCNKTLITGEIIEKCPKLKYIGLFATGYNNIDIEMASKRGITVCNAGNYSTFAVAQHTFALILEHYSKVSVYNNDVKDGKWMSSPIFSYFPYPTSELYGKTLSVIGFGNIGQTVAEIGSAFGMNILVSTHTKPIKCKYECVEIDKAFCRADVLTIHCPLTEKTKGLVCLDRLKSMKPSALIINTSRGGVVIESDLTYALNNGFISGAGLDVLEAEPMSENTPLRYAQNCIISPHTAWAAYETRVRLVNIVIDNLVSFISGNIKNKVN